MCYSFQGRTALSTKNLDVVGMSQRRDNLTCIEKLWFVTVGIVMYTEVTPDITDTTLVT